MSWFDMSEPHQLKEGNGRHLSLERVPEVLEQLHNNSGHMGLEKTIDRVRERTCWPGYTRDTEEIPNG